MKNLFILVAVLALFTCCGSNPHKSDPLASANDSLSMVIASKDSIINDAFNSIGEIADNINQIAERERLISQQTSANVELTKPVRELIAENIQAISNLLDKNRVTISRLHASAGQLAAANVKIDALQMLVSQLQEQLIEKNEQLVAMMSQVKALKVEVESLGDVVSNLESDKEQLKGRLMEQGVSLHAVHYIVASGKDLMQMGVVDKAGFIIRTQVVNNDTSMEDFTKADNRTLERIPIGGTKVKIVTSHPKSSYMMVRGAKSVIEELVITNKAEFWSNSKILVISHR